MAEPVPAPTPAQIVIVAEITMLSYDAVATMIAVDEQDVADAKWARTLEDIELWPDIRDEAGDIKRVGSIEFFEGTGISTRLGFRNMIRLRYGQLPLITESSTSTLVCRTSAAVSVVSDW